MPAEARGTARPPSPRTLGYSGQPPRSAVLRAKAGAGDGNRTHLAGLGSESCILHKGNNRPMLHEIEPPPLTRRTHPML